MSLTIFVHAIYSHIMYVFILLPVLFLNVSNAPTYHCHAPPTPGRAWVGIIGDLQESFDKFPAPGTILCCKSPTFCIGIPETMKILGQMAQPWGHNMLTNR